MLFYDVTPTGRILARFAADIDTVDMRLPRNVDMVNRDIFKVSIYLFFLVLGDICVLLFCLKLFLCIIHFPRLLS